MGSGRCVGQAKVGNPLPAEILGLVEHYLVWEDGSIGFLD